ncbi:MAG: hypothetical protein JWL71_3943 [Acidobacteria bacterium]|nr:hypothetical protein [Acidobacteriota bacterium]
MMKRWLMTATVIYLAASMALAAWLMPTGREQPPRFPVPRITRAWPLDEAGREAARAAALRRASVWRPADAASADLGTNPPDPSGALSEAIVRCRYLDGAARGTTAKFDCVLRDGEVVKVKYGHTGEIHAELAASRLLTALGFGADRMYLVPRVRCYGCIRTPFYTNWVLDKLRARAWVARSVPEDSYTDFEWAAVERHFDGLSIEAGAHEGWAWFELDAVDPSLPRGRTDRDALRLAAMLLAHWDNKAANQRLVCLAPPPTGAAPCPRPFALINDLGATFGPNKVDIDHWKAAPIWSDRARCTVSMRQFPYSGSTFLDTAIGETGRQLIARQLLALSERQVLALFSGARFSEFGGGRSGDDERAWAAVFVDKVHQIAGGAPCPAL